MSGPILSERHARHKAQLGEQLKRLLAFCARLGNNELHELVTNLLANLDQPFLFVVVGEVKSGKSSFVNALLGAEICAVDPAPCTDMIQQIVYAEQAEEYLINPQLKRIGLPREILKSIAIVDTPGTNTVIEHHQELTQKFIPNSDLVFVVFPSKNPHTRTAWDFLDFVAEEWRKSVVFILQQADLARPDELSVNTEKVIEYARQHGIPAPRVFATSAELESQGREDSGFEEIREMIRETVTGGKHYRLKLESIIQTADRVVAQIDQRLKLLKTRLERDRAIVDAIHTRLTAGKKRSQHGVNSLADRLVASYDRITAEATAEFKDGLSFFVLLKKSFRSIFSRKKKSIKEWLDQLQTQLDERLQKTLEEIAQDGAQHFVDGIRQLLRTLLEQLEKGSFEPYRDTEMLARIADRRERIINDVRTRIVGLLRDDKFIAALIKSTSGIAPKALSGGALALVGTIIMSVTHVTLLDVTGGVLTGVGVLLASGVLIFKRGGIVNEFRRRLEDAREQFDSDLRENLAAELQVIFDDIERDIAAFYEHVEKEQRELSPLLDDFAEFSASLHSLRHDLTAK